MPMLLVVDDEPGILAAFRRAFRDGTLEVQTAETAREALQFVRERPPDVLIVDVQLPDQTGLDLFRQLKEVHARCPVIFITGRSTTDTAIEAMKLGAFEYLLKPLELPVLRQVVDRALEISRLVNVPAALPDEVSEDGSADAIVGRCPAMQEVYKSIGRVAAQDFAVLITGESGTGKELVARAIYQHSRRAQGPFLAINCAAIPETLLESELFGHERGAFTGAERRRIGKFEQCSGGTLFLDEVGDMPPLVQSKLLRVLQEQRFERVGGNETITTDVRILAATNRDLDRLVAEGHFRQDLYYRLSGYRISLPPLRERGDDLTLLVAHYLRRLNRELGKEVQTIAPEVLTRFRQHDWPGNVRELQSVLRQALLQAVGSVLLPDFLPRSWPATPSPLPAEIPATTDLSKLIDQLLHQGSHELYAQCLEWLERTLLTRVLQQTGGNQVQAAKILGITRGSLRTKIRDLGITIGRTISTPDVGEE